MRLFGEGIPGFATSVNDSLGVVEETERQEAFAQVEPNPLDGVELRAVWRERDQGDVAWEVGLAELVPTGTVEHDDGVGVRIQGLGEGVEEQPGGAGGDLRQDEREVVAGSWPHGAEDVGPLVSPIADPWRPLAAQPPAMADPAFVADARLVLEPELKALVGMGLGRRLQGGAEPLFLKRLCASALPCGCTGRAFCREKSRRRNTRVKLEGW